MRPKKINPTKKITVSIGIPAYNEEANIGSLLKSLLAQKQKDFVLKEIIVVSDKSEDRTDEIVKSFKDKKIHLIVNKKRLGQSPGQEKIIQEFSSEILVLLNADILPVNNLFLEKVIEPFRNNKKIGLVSPVAIPLKAKNQFEAIMNFSYECRESMLRSWNKGNNVLHCHGMARAFRKELVKTVKWPTSVGEDAYTYFWCLKNNYEFKYQSKTQFNYRSPDNFTDYKRQSNRFLGSQKIMSELFGKKLVAKEYNIPFSLKAQSTIRYFFKNPFYWTVYAVMFILSCLNPNKSRYSNTLWEISKSSKILNANAT